MNSPDNSPPQFNGILSEKEQKLLEQSGKSSQFETDEIIFRRGEQGDSMYFIEEGKIEILFEDGKFGKTLGPGGYFGEIALLTGGNTRSATAVTTAPSQLRVIKPEVITQLRETHPEFLCTLMQSSFSYLLNHEQELITTLNRKNHELEQTLDYLRRTKEDLNTSELQANTDELTGLYNRRCFNRQITRFMEQAQSLKTGLALLMIDLDKFKAINDTHGHNAGDLVLKFLSELIKAHSRYSDLPCRLGGDEFAILMANISEPDKGFHIAERLCSSIAESSIRIPTACFKMSVSIGGAMYKVEDTPESMVQRADESLYLAKNNGRNRVAWMGQLMEHSSKDT